MMIDLQLGIILVIIFSTLSTFEAHFLKKRDLSPPTIDPPELIPRLSSVQSKEKFWFSDDYVGYLQDQVKDSIEYQRSRLLSSLISSVSEALDREEKNNPTPEYPQVQTNKESENEPQVEVEEQKAVSEDWLGQDKLEQELKQRNEPFKKNREEEEEAHIKNEKSDVHLFGPPEQKDISADFKSRDVQDRLRTILGIRVTDNDYSSLKNQAKPPAGATSHFSYNHPEEWSLDNPECSGRLQSPVNLDTDKLIRLDVSSKLVWSGYWNHPENLTIMDNGHSVQLNGMWDEKTVPFISGGPLEGDYIFSQLHFHWGRKDAVGSEHTINNSSFPMEMHMVHYKRDYGSLNNALKYDDGLTVVAFLFEISEKLNFGIDLLEDSLGKIQLKPRASISVKPYPLAFFHSMFQEDYASYIGSLTTPPCREIVTWLVSSTPLTVSRKQLEAFRQISDKWPDKENHRPRQALNGRRLYYIAH